METTPRKSNILMVLFPGFNTLDMNGPYEVLRRSGRNENCKITVASETEITTAVEGVQVKRDIALDDSLLSSLADYDMLVIPGGPSKPGQPVAVQVDKLSSPFMTLISAFTKLPKSDSQFPRILLSICTGAIFLGAVGAFNGLYCTTHWGAYQQLTDTAKAGAVRTSGQPGTVIPARFVDAGLHGDLHVISSGGVSCGIDASLHVIKLRYGEAVAAETAQLLDYAWRKTDGVVFSGDQ